MPSYDNGAPARTVSRRLALVLEGWNRKLHFYLGLYLLFFLWLFAFTGLLLNHPKWTFAEFWPNRKLSKFERPITVPAAGPDLAQAKDLLLQLGLSGEIEWTTARADSSRLNFRASRPGRTYEIKADFTGRRAAVESIELNAWGVMHILHTFTGARIGDARNQRDWLFTSLWALAMDAVALGLIIMVLGSYYMWLRLPGKRVWGVVSLACGTVLCGLFLFGLRWLF